MSQQQSSEFHHELSKMKKKSSKLGNNLKDYLNKNQPVEKNIDKLSQFDNKSLDCLLRKKKYNSQNVYKQIKNIVDVKYFNLINKTQNPPLPNYLSHRDYLKKKDTPRDFNLNECDKIIESTRKKLEQIVQKDKTLYKIKMLEDQREQKERMKFERQLSIIQRKLDNNNGVKIKRRKKKLNKINNKVSKQEKPITFHDFVKRQDELEINENLEAYKDQVLLFKIEALQYQKFFQKYFNLETENDVMELIDKVQSNQQLEETIQKFIDNSSTIDFSKYSDFLERRKSFFNNQKIFKKEIKNKNTEIKKVEEEEEEKQEEKQENDLDKEYKLDSNNLNDKQQNKEKQLNLNISQQEQHDYLTNVKRQLIQFYRLVVQLQPQALASCSSSQPSVSPCSTPPRLNTPARHLHCLQAIQQQCASIQRTPSLKSFLAIN